MGDKSAIEWTDATWNPVTGCSKVSPGCAHCYAEALALGRLAGKPGYPGLPWTPENAAENVVLRPDRLDQPIRWRRPRMVFVNSMSDLFHELVPFDYIDRVFAVMAWAERHTFQVLTKRPERMREYLSDPERQDRVEHAMCSVCCSKVGNGICGWPGEDCGLDGAMWPLPNVWLGVSIESREHVGRADLLRQTPAAARFISAEPLLGPLFEERDGCPEPVWDGPYRMRCSLGGTGTVCARHGEFVKEREGLDLTGIDWLIAGGESGPGHRPIDPQWVRDLRDACLAAQEVGWKCSRCGWRTADLDTMHREVNWREPDDSIAMVCPDCGAEGQFEDWNISGPAFFLKQWGGRTPKAGGRELDGRTWDEMPVVDDARVAA
jgi:protein gp37